MEVIYQVLGYPLGWVMWALYGIIHNYGLALLLFTVLIRLALFPLSLKQQKSSTKMMTIQPKVTDIQTRYKDNKEKLNEELMKLYQKEGYNPMSGCLPLLIQMPVLFGLIDVIYKPLYHILRLSSEVIEQGGQILSQITNTPVQSGLSYQQLDIIRSVKENPEAFMAMGRDVVERIQGLNLTFLWMDLTVKPDVSMFGHIFTNFNPVIIIPLLSGISALVVAIQSMRVSPQQQAAGGMKGMMYIMPIFSTWIAFSVPAGVGLYWFYSNACAMIQTYIMNKIYNPKEMMEKAKREFEEQQERERQEKIEARKKLKEKSPQGNADGEDITKALSQKEINRKKLAEARKRDAEKYGEEYIEVTDDDLR